MAADQGKVTLLGLLDLSSEFDCVDHRIFLRRMELSFGVTDRALAWSASYLGDRSQCVRYNGVDSRTASISCGVPQGSVLGPAYFLLYSAAVFGIARRYGFLIHGYADDLQLYQHCASPDMDSLNTRFVNCLQAIQEWMSRNRLRLNASKTEVILVGVLETAEELDVACCRALEMSHPAIDDRAQSGCHRRLRLNFLRPCFEAGKQLLLPAASDIEPYEDHWQSTQLMFLFEHWCSPG